MSEVLTGEVLEWVRGVWRVVKIGNVPVTDRRRIRPFDQYSIWPRSSMKVYPKDGDS